MISSVVTLSSFKIQDSCSIRREKPRPSQLRQVDYDLKYDEDTLFYDVFRDEDKIRFSGPPLFNLTSILENAKLLSDGQEPVDKQFADLDRTQHSWGRFDNDADSLTISSELGVAKLSIGSSFNELFRGSRTLVTKSKNNDLNWIRDWVTFHVENQGVDAALIYDNGSTEYDATDILKVLRSIKGLRLAFVVVWPYKFGPQGGNWGGVKNAPWDSDFTEYSILEHARYRFLKSASMVISADIDELVMSDSGHDLYNMMKVMDVPGLAYRGRWITTVRDEENTHSPSVSFRDFVYYDKQTPPTTQKWTIQPVLCSEALQWKTHSIAGADLYRTTEVCHRHFVGISSNWKMQRTNEVKFDQSRHTLDSHLVNAQICAGIKDGIFLETHDVNHNLLEGIPMENGDAKLLQSIGGLLAKQNFPYPLTAAKFYSENCLTVESKLNGYKIGFDFVQVNNGIQLKAVARDESSQGWLKNIFSPRPQAARSSAKHFYLADIPAASGAQSIVETFKDQISWILSRSSAVTYANLSNTNHSSASYPTYWWKGRTNFGDLIGPLLVERISGRKPENMKDTEIQGPCLVTVGSVLNLLERSDTEIWGSGLIAPLHAKSIQHLGARKPLKIHAVRGWRTYKELTEKMGWNVPRVFGDPALLLPRVFEPKLLTDTRPVLIPHYVHAKYFGNLKQDFRVLDVERSAEEVVSEIANARSVVSTSLHGIIVAQAYGVPWTWLRLHDVTLAGDQFKFEDFFSVLDRSTVKEISITSKEVSITTMTRAISMAGLPKNKFDFNNLLDSFPNDF